MREPINVFRVRRQTAVFLPFLLLALTIGVVASGLFDPQPIGSLQQKRPLSPQTIPAATTQTVWLETPPLPETFSVRLTAVLTSGEPDSGYGLLLGSPDHYLAFAVSPLGLYSIWENMHHASRITHHAWQPWPHVALGQQPNELWLDVAGDQLTLRLNREWLWAGEWDGAKRQVGLVGSSFGEKTAVVDFQQLDLFWEEEIERLRD